MYNNSIHGLSIHWRGLIYASGHVTLSPRPLHHPGHINQWRRLPLCALLSPLSGNIRPTDRGALGQATWSDLQVVIRKIMFFMVRFLCRNLYALGRDSTFYILATLWLFKRGELFGINRQDKRVFRYFLRATVCYLFFRIKLLVHVKTLRQSFCKNLR